MIATLAFLLLGALDCDKALSQAAPSSPTAQEQQVEKIRREVVNKIADAETRTIIEAMRKAYAECKTYTDTGKMTTVETLSGRESSVSFSTWFKRPGRLCIKFRGKDYVRDGQFVLWISGERRKMRYQELDGRTVEDDTWPTDSWSPDTKEHRKEWTLDIASGAFTGISKGATDTVPQMLFPAEIGGSTFGDMEDLYVLGPEKDRGVECDVLYSSARSMKIWIDKKTHLLRRVHERGVFAGYVYSSDSVYTPEVNVEVNDQDLAFKPPTRSRHVAHADAFRA